MNIRHTLMAAVLVVASFTSSASLIAVIDDFSTAQGPLTVAAGETAFSSVTGTGILGGERDLAITNFVDSFNQGASVNVAADNLFFSSGSGNESQFTIQWDGVDGSAAINPFGLGGLNLGSGAITFITSIVEADLNAFFDVTFWSGAQGTSETVELPIPGVQAPGRDAFFSSTLFTATDFTNIGAIQVRGNIISPDTGDRVRAYDLQLSEVTAVSAPATLAMSALALGGLLLRRRA
jgi:hypothetical protein